MEIDRVETILPAGAMSRIQRIVINRATKMVSIYSRDRWPIGFSFKTLVCSATLAAELEAELSSVPS